MDKSVISVTGIPKICVLLAARNGENYLIEQINSIQSQVGVSVYIFCRNDGSNDSTLEKLVGLANENESIHLLHEDKVAGSASANFFELIRSIDALNYDFFSLADQDDFWLPDKLLRGITKLQSQNCDGYSCAVKAVDKNLFKIHNGIVRQFPVTTRYDFFFEGAGQGCTYIMSRKLFTEVQFLLEKDIPALRQLHYHDWLIYSVSRVLDMKWYFDQDPYILYRQHENNDTGVRGSLRGFKFRLQRIRSGWYKKQILIIANILDTNFSDIRSKVVLSLLQNRSLTARIRLIFILFNHSRRKQKERIFLTFLCLVGWF